MDAYEARRKFFEENGEHIVVGSRVVNDNGARVAIGARIMFANGARAERDSLYGALVPPPADPWQRQKLIVEYLEIVLERLTKRHNEEYYEIQQCLHSLQRGLQVSITDHMVKSLIEAADAVKKYRRKLKKAREKYEALTPKEVLEKRELNKEAAQERIATVQKFNDLLQTLRV